MYIIYSIKVYIYNLYICKIYNMTAKKKSQTRPLFLFPLQYFDWKSFYMTEKDFAFGLFLKLITSSTVLIQFCSLFHWSPQNCILLKSAVIDYFQWMLNSLNWFWWHLNGILTITNGREACQVWLLQEVYSQYYIYMLVLLYMLHLA